MTYRISARCSNFSPMILLKGKTMPLSREEACGPRLIQLPKVAGSQEQDRVGAAHSLLPDHGKGWDAPHSCRNP